MKFLKSMNLECCCKLINFQGLENLNCSEEIYLDDCNCLSTSFEYSLFQGYFGRFLSCNVYLPRREIPHWFNDQRLGSSISFVIENDYVELTLWLDYVQESKHEKWNGPIVENISGMHKKTNGIEWFHYGYHLRAFTSEAKRWVKYRSQPYPVKTGDEIEVSFKALGDIKVEKCGVHVAYKPIIGATKRSSVFTSETYGNDSALETSCNENIVSKR